MILSLFFFWCLVLLDCTCNSSCGLLHGIVKCRLSIHLEAISFSCRVAVDLDLLQVLVSIFYSMKAYCFSILSFEFSCVYVCIYIHRKKLNVCHAFL